MVYLVIIASLELWVWCEDALLREFTRVLGDTPASNAVPYLTGLAVLAMSLTALDAAWRLVMARTPMATALYFVGTGLILAHIVRHFNHYREVMTDLGGPTSIEAVVMGTAVLVALPFGLILLPFAAVHRDRILAYLPFSIGRRN